MNQTVKATILRYLDNKKNYVFGGLVEDHVRSKLGSKASNASRRCRELLNDGRLQRTYELVSSRWVVKYRVKNKNTA